MGNRKRVLQAIDKIRLESECEFDSQDDYIFILNNLSGNDVEYLDRVLYGEYDKENPMKYWNQRLTEIERYQYNADLESLVTSFKYQNQNYLKRRGIIDAPTKSILEDLYYFHYCRSIMNKISKYDGLGAEIDQLFIMLKFTNNQNN